MTLLQAISVSEGFPIAGSRSQRNNNPGDLIWGDEAEHFGATHGDTPGQRYKGYGGFAVFPLPQVGWRALQRWLSVPARFDRAGNLIGGYVGATLSQIIHRFAPPTDGNDTAAYISGVCERTGLTPETIIVPAMLQTPEVVEVT